MTEYYIGTSGWHYKDWKGIFYPSDLSKSKWLEFYGHYFATVELNNSFYRLPSEKAFHSWQAESPNDFIFAVKASRFITHVKRLKDADEPLHAFLERADLLARKLGPILYQLPPNMKRNDERLKTFVDMLPARYQHVLEFRHESWFDDEIMALLRMSNVAFCVFDMPELTSPVVATADFAYVRFHGSAGLYSNSYTDKELAGWANKISKLGKNLKAVYIYFDNDISGYAIDNARTLMKILKPKP